MRVRFNPAEVARAGRDENGNPIPNAVPLPGPHDRFTVVEVFPWTDKKGDQHFDEDAWANLGPEHPRVLVRLLEAV